MTSKDDVWCHGSTYNPPASNDDPFVFCFVYAANLVKPMSQAIGVIAYYLATYVLSSLTHTHNSFLNKQSHL